MADTNSELRPAQALLSPAWLLALALLIVNDHLLKTAGLMPAVITGKLSDVAGMIVAPALLATLIGVHRRRALLACHVAVGAVFSAIQLWPGAAGLWSAGMGLLGYPWTITCDPSDLLALPVLGLSWVWLTPHMDPSRPPLATLQRSAVAGLALVGLWASVATTEGNDDPFVFDGFEDVSGNVYINNNNDEWLELHVRYVRADVELRCDEVAADPGRLLSEVAFGEAEHWSLPPWTNLGIDPGSSDCGAAWVAGEGIAPTILFFDVASHPRQSWPGQLEEGSDPFGAGLGLRISEDGPIEWIEGEDAAGVRFTPRTDTPSQPASCEPPPAQSRIDWSTGISERPVSVLAIEAGIDGCYALQLQGQELVGGEPAAIGEPYEFYLCVPETAMALTGGESLRMSETKSQIGTRELTLTLLDPTTLEPALDAGRLVLNMRMLHGGNDPAFIGPAVGREFEAVVDASCPFALTEGCATAERVAGLRVVGGDSVLVAGDSAAFADAPGPGAMVRLAVLASMHEFAVVDGACAVGSQVLSYDIDIAVIEQPLL